jgi:hypothetical protein
MPFLHKFQNHNFGNGFETNNSILDIVPYEPEVIFIGTYNHGWSWNESDFFYGRGMYMWPALANLFLYDSNHLVKKRDSNNSDPSYLQLFEICKKGKIVFADIVKGIKEDINAIENLEEKCVIVNNEYVWKSYKDKPLDFMASKNWIDDNVEEIINYINRTKSIKHVYFTFKSGDWLIDKLNEIKFQTRHEVTSFSIFTPTANGFRENLPPPFEERLWSLTHCWLWNNLNHEIPIFKNEYGSFDHEWLLSNGVNPHNF